MAVFSLGQFFREQRSTFPPLKPAFDVSSKTFVVTGSSVGLGFEASVHIAKMGPELLVATSRDSAKCEQTRESILERATAAAAAKGDVPGPRVAAWPLDLDSFESVCSFADRFAANGDSGARASNLNALVANAGLFQPDYVQTRDGWEVMLQVNYLSTALLSILLLPHLMNASTSKDSPVARLVVVSSLGQYLGPASLQNSEAWTNILETINDEKFASSVARYNVTKLLEVMFVRELAARLPNPTPVVACAVNPGFCRSSLFRAVQNKWYIRWVYPAIQKALFVRSTEEGAKTLVHPTVSGEPRAMHGRYLSCCQVTEESDFVFTPQGKAFSAKLWDETITVLSRADGRVSDIVAKHLQAHA